MITYATKKSKLDQRSGDAINNKRSSNWRSLANDSVPIIVKLFCCWCDELIIGAHRSQDIDDRCTNCLSVLSEGEVEKSLFVVVDSFVEVNAINLQIAQQTINKFANIEFASKGL